MLHKAIAISSISKEVRYNETDDQFVLVNVIE